MKPFQIFAPLLLATLWIGVMSLHDAVGQVDDEAKHGRAHIMDLSLQFDADANKVACLGDPSVLEVKPGDIVVFRAKGTFVNHVRWADDPAAQQQNPQPLNYGKPNLAAKERGQTVAATPRFERGTAYAVKIASAREFEEGNKVEYDLVVKCGDLDDAPPRIIVDP